MRFSLKVRHYEVDEYGHVNHANYVHYLETARVEALEAVGLSLREMRRQGVIAVAADLS
jgi:acyl-CoA thioester hydrolase/thioesterase-3